jgi:hypothetical protein
MISDVRHLDYINRLQRVSARLFKPKLLISVSLLGQLISLFISAAVASGASLPSAAIFDSSAAIFNNSAARSGLFLHVYSCTIGLFRKNC